MNYTKMQINKNTKINKQRLKIILVYPGYPPEEQIGGGISTFAQEAARGLAEAGNKITVISRSASHKLKVENQEKNIQIFRVPEETWFTKKFKMLNFRKTGVFWYSRRIKQLIKRIEKKEGPVDIIECGDWGAEAISLLRPYKKKLLIRCHTPSFISEKYNPSDKPYLSSFIKFLEKYILKNAQYIACPGESLILAIKQHVTLRDKVVIQPYPLKINDIPYKVKYAQNFSSKRPFKILVAGRIEERKGQDIVCQAMNSLIARQFPVKLVFAGADTYLKDGKTYKSKLLEILTSRTRECVSFLGHVPRDKIFSLYPEFDCYVMSSRFESLGFVTLEAMRSGLPVIASNICEMPRLIHDGVNGNLFEVNNPKELAKKIENMIRKPNMVENMGKSARNFILEYSYNNPPIQQMIDLYYSIGERS